ncbi:MAG: hypothetical protein PHQ20_00575 [Candidatus Moranbacteria bacterium]|nr:hypothetical protein [Candidatus Moranbacteria bacterium]
MNLKACFKFLKEIFDRQTTIVLFFGLIMGIINLALTLNIEATLIIFILAVAMAVFIRSFSKGWLFLLGVALIFPAFRVGDFLLFDFFLVLIIVLTLAQFIIENMKFEFNPIYFKFFLFILIGVSFIVFSYIFSGNVQLPVWKILLSFLLIFFLFFSFQYFFQTRKRIKRFLVLIVVSGTIHSLFGIVSFLLNWQIIPGMGVINGQAENALWGLSQGKISGFLGINLESLIGHNFLSAFLVMSIISTAGLIFLLETDRGKMNNSKTSKQKIFLVLALTIQSIGLFLTFSYSSLISVSLGILIMGIITRNNRVIFFSTGLIILFTVLAPRLFSFSGSAEIMNFDHIIKIFKHWIMGNGIISERNRADIISGGLFNSYLFLWNYYGLFGFFALLSILYSFFIDIYLSYKKAHGQERIMLAMITGIFMASIIEGFSGNVLVFGPTALVFWLFYAVTLNLKNNLIPVSFIMKSGLFFNGWGFFIRKKTKAIDSAKRRVEPGVSNI